MVLHDLDYAYDTLDVCCQGYIEWIELKEFDETIYFEPLDIDQLEATITTVCGAASNGRCRKEYFPDVVKELERRHNIAEKVKWDFRALDVEEVGRLSIQATLFLFKAVHGDRFSNTYWKKFLNSRINQEEDVSFDEIKPFLCDIPEFASANSDSDFAELSKKVEKDAQNQNYNNYSEFQKMQEDDAYLAATERDRNAASTKIKNNAEYLLNRLDDIGLHALLEDDLGDGDFEGRPIEKVTATELLNALKAKYEVLREKLLKCMLRLHIGEGMWQALSENEQHEKLFQLKLKESKIRKDEKLDTLARHLPGAQNALQYNVFGLMGESDAELQRRMQDEENKVKESDLPPDEVREEFLKKLDDKDKQKSSTEAALIEINNRYLLEKEELTNKLQGLSGCTAISPSERENLLFIIIQMQLRGVQESEFPSCGLCIGLTERILSKKHDRSFKDEDNHHNLSSYRIKSHKYKRAHDGPTVPPKLYKIKTRLGKVDLLLLLIQDCEWKYALEREEFLKLMNSKECLMHRMSARKLTQEERLLQLSVLLAQWQGWRSKTSEEKLQSRGQTYRILEEAMSLRFEHRKEELRLSKNPSADDLLTSVNLLAALQMQQDKICRNLLNVGNMTKSEVENYWKEQQNAIKEEWFDNIAIVLFGIIETTEEEEELLKALKDKYDTLRDKLLMDALMQQYSQAEWDALSERERQARLAKLKLLEKKLRREGKYDELAQLLGDAAQNSDLLNKMLGENRQKYLDQLNDRLRNRERRIAAGEDPDIIDQEMLEETPDKSTGNVLRDLDKRFEDERDALLRNLRDENDRQRRERERQQELARLRMEARKAGRESNFDSAALVLGLAERNKAALEDRLKNDRERQEELARQRLEALRKRKRSSKTHEKPEDNIEPHSDDLVGWQEFVLKALIAKHEKERQFLADLLQDTELEDVRQEAIQMSMDERHDRLNKLRSKRNALDIAEIGDQEEHVSILEMAISVKYVFKEEEMKTNKPDLTTDDIIISLMADLQQLQDNEMRDATDIIQNKTHPELVALRTQHVEETTNGLVKNVAELAFTYNGQANDDEIVKALDKKYDALLDKLALEALEKQMNDAEWANLSEKERQAKMLKMRLEQKRLLKEGKFDEAARLLGEGFQADANLKKLMGENKKKYDELLQERLRLRRERIANGESVDDLPELVPEDFVDENEPVDGKALLEDLQKRYDDEKEALLARLHGADAQFMSERERQAELARLKREQRRAVQEEKFGAAAMVLGLAERNKAAANDRLENDRKRQEEIAKARLERLRQKRNSQGKQPDEELSVATEGDLITAVLKLIEKRHAVEQEDLAQYLQNIDETIHEQSTLLTSNDRTNRLQHLKQQASGEEAYVSSVQEMSSLKICNRMESLKNKNKESRVSNDDVIISIMADLQQRQDKESESVLKALEGKTNEELITYQENEIKLCTTKLFPNLPNILSQIEDADISNDDTVVNALEAKYDALKDKLILDALEKQMGEAAWKNLDERERQKQLMKIKLEERKLKQEGKFDEATILMNKLLKQDTNLQSLLGSTKAEQERRMKEKLEARKKRKEAGMSEAEIEKLESEEDAKYEEENANTTSGNLLQDLENNFEAEKDALMSMLQNAGNRMDTERQRQLALARLRRDQKRAQAEEKFDAVALVFGMAKSQQAALNSKMAGDRSRQEQLARQRLEARKRKRQQQQQQQGDEDDEDDSKQIDDENEDVNITDDTTDVLVLQEAALNEMEKKHSLERELLMKLIQEVSSNPSFEKSKQLTDQDRKTKLVELREYRKQWRDSAVDPPSEQNEIFTEAIPLKMFDLKSQGIEDTEVKLLADLQEEQDKEAEYTMKDLNMKNAATLKQLIKIQQLARQSQWYDNMAAALLGGKTMMSSTTNDTEKELVEALKEKYDALKEKVFIEALRNKFGDETWENMCEKEKQEHLNHMKASNEINKDDTQIQSDLDSVALPGMEKLIAKTRAKQERKLKDRMERRKLAKAEGRSLENLAQEEKEEDEADENDVANGNDVLKDLEDQFENERDAIFKALQDSDTHELSERERQLALARLRREKRRIAKEEKYDGAALVLNLAKKNQKATEQSYENERARQEKLARERIDAMRRRKKQSVEEETRQAVAADEKDDLKLVEQLQREGTMAVQDSVLNEAEKKHSAEQQAMLEMLQSLDTKVLEEAKKMTADECATNISSIKVKRDRVKERTRGFLNSQPPVETMNELEKKAFDETLASGRQSLQNVIQDGLALLVGQKIQNLSSSTELSLDDLREEAGVLLMADLQEKQTKEINVLMEALKNTDRITTDRLRLEQRKARRAGWMDNISEMVFQDDAERKRKAPPPDPAAIEQELKEEEAKVQEEADDEMKKFSEELEAEKKRRLTSSMSENEMQALVDEMQQREQMKRNELSDQMKRQREIARQRLEEKRRKRDDKLYENDLAFAMIANAQKHTKLIREKTMAVQGAQKDSLEERLRLRREARKKRQAEEEENERIEQEKLEKEEKEKMKQEQGEEPASGSPEKQATPVASTHTPSSQSTENVQPTVGAVESTHSAKSVHSTTSSQSDVKKKKAMPPLPGGGMRREKTVVEQAAEISQKKKEEMIDVLIREQTSLALKINKEQSRQEEMVRLLREKRRRKMEAREQEAAAVLGLGERQKTMVEDRKKVESTDSINNNNRQQEDDTIVEEEEEEDGNQSSHTSIERAVCNVEDENQSSHSQQRGSQASVERYSDEYFEVTSEGLISAVKSNSDNQSSENMNNRNQSSASLAQTEEVNISRRGSTVSKTESSQSGQQDRRNMQSSESINQASEDNKSDISLDSKTSVSFSQSNSRCKNQSNQSITSRRRNQSLQHICDDPWEKGMFQDVDVKFQGERERQIGAVRDRLQRMKYERTLKDTNNSENDGDDETNKTFATLAQEQPDDLTEDEKMQKIAQEMERKFKEGGTPSLTKDSTENKNEDPENTTTSENVRRESSTHGKLDEKTREQILKERQKSKKLRRRTTTNAPTELQDDNKDDTV